ncbi:MAG: HNH endonuclease signature motif containing protein [Burkholderiaceae bacterium]
MRQHKPKTLPSAMRKTLTPNRTLALNSAAWGRLRAAVLDDEPLCRHCYAYGRVNFATDVDHIDNDASNNDRNNLQALCHECHSRKTMADMGHRVATGCDAHGRPLDPHHHWNREKSPATEAAEPPAPLRARDRS